jgi:hypothetical protein
MLVFNELKCMFTPICKVGTNSFFNYWGGVVYGEEDAMIRKMKDGDAIGKNTKIIRQQLRHRVNKDFNIIWKPPSVNEFAYINYYKFAFVRNPWTRIVSAFRELIRRYPFGMPHANEKAGLTYDEIYDLMDGHVDFENFINFVINIERDHTNVINGHWRPQVIVLSMHRAMTYDFIGRLENVDNDLNKAQKRLGLEETKLSKEHETAEYNYKLYYKNKKTIDMVGEYFKDDIETFGYEYEQNN